MTHVLNDPEHWLKRAEEARTLAGELTDSEARRMMLNIADGYDRLAKRAEARAKFNERFDAADFELHVVGDDIIVNVPGTRFTITFQRTPDKTGIEEKHAWARDEYEQPIQYDRVQDPSMGSRQEARLCPWLDTPILTAH
jgi:hypothetical protein